MDTARLYLEEHALVGREVQLSAAARRQVVRGVLPRVDIESKTENKFIVLKCSIATTGQI